jgi:YD repeat-containing protein
VEFTGNTKDVAIYLHRTNPMSLTTYNEKGQVETQCDAGESCITYTYDNFGRQVSATRDVGDNSCCREGKTFYNRYGQVTSTLAPDGRITIFAYDKLGNQTATYLGALVEVKDTYKVEDLPVNEEFDISRQHHRTATTTTKSCY